MNLFNLKDHYSLKNNNTKEELIFGDNLVTKSVLTGFVSNPNNLVDTSIYYQADSMHLVFDREFNVFIAIGRYSISILDDKLTLIRTLRNNKFAGVSISHNEFKAKMINSDEVLVTTTSLTTGHTKVVVFDLYANTFTPLVEPTTSSELFLLKIIKIENNILYGIFKRSSNEKNILFGKINLSTRNNFEIVADLSDVFAPNIYGQTGSYINTNELTKEIYVEIYMDTQIAKFSFDFQLISTTTKASSESITSSKFMFDFENNQLIKNTIYSNNFAVELYKPHNFELITRTLVANNLFSGSALEIVSKFDPKTKMMYVTDSTYFLSNTENIWMMYKINSKGLPTLYKQGSALSSYKEFTGEWFNSVQLLRLPFGYKDRYIITYPNGLAYVTNIGSYYAFRYIPNKL